MNNKLYCFNKLEELFSLYDKVRQAVILLENFNEEQKMYIAPINQLRSALDHIFKAINVCNNTKQCEYEKKKKKEKLKIWGISILLSIISGLAVGVIMFFMTK